MSLRDHRVIICSGIAISAFGLGWLANVAVRTTAGQVVIPRTEQQEFERLKDENKELKEDLEVYSKLNSITSSFNLGDSDGWTVNALSARLIRNQGVSLTNGDGYIQACDPVNDGKTTYFISPAQFFGNLSSFTHLMFSLYSEGGDYYQNADVRINNQNISAEYYFPDRPEETWETFLISLEDDRGWTIQEENITLQEILQNVTSIEIRGEFGRGQDCAGLDNVMLLKK